MEPGRNAAYGLATPSLTLRGVRAEKASRFWAESENCFERWTWVTTSSPRRGPALSGTESSSRRDHEGSGWTLSITQPGRLARQTSECGGRIAFQTPPAPGQTLPPHQAPTRSAGIGWCDDFIRDVVCANQAAGTRLDPRESLTGVTPQAVRCIGQHDSKAPGTPDGGRRWPKSGQRRACQFQAACHVALHYDCDKSDISDQRPPGDTTVPGNLPCYVPSGLRHKRQKRQKVSLETRRSLATHRETTSRRAGRPSRRVLAGPAHSPGAVAGRRRCAPSAGDGRRRRESPSASCLPGGLAVR